MAGSASVGVCMWSDVFIVPSSWWNRNDMESGSADGDGRQARRICRRDFGKLELASTRAALQRTAGGRPIIAPCSIACSWERSSSAAWHDMPQLYGIW